MSLVPEDVAELNDLRSTILANQQAGRPSYEGISQERLKKALSLLRSDRKQASAEKKKKGKTKAASDVANLSLDSLFDKK